ncbi:MAG: ribosomal-processing cysteine protease Prp, partial [Bacillota bacterium]
MLSIKIEGSSGDDLVGFEVRGHAEYADAGEDIVCAGVSAVLQTAALALEQLFSIKPHLVVKPGHM